MRRLGWVWAMGGLAWASAALAEDPPLPASMNLAQALDLFKVRGFDLLIADAAVQSAEGDARIAGGIANPGLSLSYGTSFYLSCPNPPCSAPPPGLGGGVTDSAALLDWISGKRGLRKDVAAAALSSARLSRADAERSLIFQVKSQFIQVLLARDSLKFAKEVAEANQKMLDLMLARNKAGAVSDADVLRVKVAKLEADQAADQSAQALRTAKVGLAFLLGVRSKVPDFEVEQPELMHFVVPPRLASATRDSMLKDAIAARPDLMAQKAQVERAEASSSLARRQRLPDITLSANYAQQGTDPLAITPPTFTFGLSTNLPVFYQQQGEVQKADADFRTQQLQEAKLEAQVVNDLETAWTNFVATRALVERMEEGTLLESARRAKDLVFIQYQKGAASLLDYLSAQAQFTASMVEYLNDLTNYWTAVFALEKAAGTELR
jgi:cobalt-zinc-cadmium efflux system outer membrane protein